MSPSSPYTESETIATRIDRVFRELNRAIKFDHPSISLAVYRSEFVREEVEAALRRRLQDLAQDTDRVFINEQNHDLPLYLRERADRAKTVFFVSGIRFGGGDDGQNAYRALNIRREYFVDYKLRLVLWLTEEEERLLPRYAPDFWAFRHLVVTFLDEPGPEQIRKNVSQVPWQDWDNKTFGQDTNAKIAYRERLLAELPHTPETTANRAKLLYTLAPLYAATTQLAQAITSCEQAFDLAHQIGDIKLQSWCQNVLGNVYRDNGRYPEAIDAY
ncbi:MAG: hypothetical protein CSB13_10150, partial [Chloroflexi bacterium]